MNIAATINDAIGAVCPIDGVSLGSESDKSTWLIRFSAAATAQQKQAAVAVLAGFDITTVQRRVIQDALEMAVQGWLDGAAQTKGYDGILSATSYATSKHPTFGPEGIAYRDWRDAVWNYCYVALAEVQAGKRAVPEVKQLLSELPPAPV